MLNYIILPNKPVVSMSFKLAVWMSFIFFLGLSDFKLWNKKDG